MKSLILFMLFISKSAFAGGDHVGNGGNSIVCKDDSGKIIQAEVFDLYEGRVLKGLSYQESPAPPLVQATALANKISQAKGSSSSEENFASETESTFKTFQFLPPGVGLKPIDDGAEVIVPTNCEKIQTANRLNSENILIDSDIWKAMSNTQKAALILHETIYRNLQRSRVQRDIVETDSSRTRRLVAHLFSGGSLEYIYSPQNYAIGKVLSCNTNKEDSPDLSSTDFYVYQDFNKALTAEFTQWLSHTVLTRTCVKSYLASNEKWPPTDNDEIIISGDLISPVESQTKAVIKFTSALSGKIWFYNRGMQTTAENFECFEVKN